MRGFRSLKVWEKAHNLTLGVYRVTRNFPKEELYGITGQIRRAASSVSANIAEGCGRTKAPDFARFLHIAMGSASELEYHILLAHDLDLLAEEEYKGLAGQVTEVKQMLTSLIRKVVADG